jgi:hypothetical protein
LNAGGAPFSSQAAAIVTKGFEERVRRYEVRWRE